jgi:drug/metabolite transporter (DMT)-like permease
MRANIRWAFINRFSTIHRQSCPMTSLAPAAARSPVAGMLWMVAAGFGFVVMDTAGKYLTADYSTIQIAWARYLFHMLTVLPVLLAWRGSAVFRTRRLGLQLLRSVFLLGATAFYFLALRYIPLATAAAIGFVAPLILTALSALILKEQVGPRRWSAVVVGFLAVLLIIRPGFGMVHWAMALPLLVAACFALYQITTRLLGAIDEWPVTLFYSGIVGLVAMSAAVPYDWRMPDLRGWAIMAFLGLAGALSHLFMIRAFTLAPASALAPLSYLQLAWAVALGYLVFGDLPDGWTVTGAVVIVLSGLYVWYRERVRAGAP